MNERVRGWVAAFQEGGASRFTAALKTQERETVCCRG